MPRTRSTLSHERAPEPRRTEIEEFVEALRAVTRAVAQFQRAAEQRWRVSAAQLLVLRILTAGAPSWRSRRLGGGFVAQPRPRSFDT